MATVAKDKTKTIRRWHLLIAGEKIPFRTKGLAVSVGKAARDLGHDIRLIEEYDLWDRGGETRSDLVLLDHQEFDRTFLINPTIKL